MPKSKKIRAIRGFMLKDYFEDNEPFRTGNHIVIHERNHIPKLFTAVLITSLPLKKRHAK